MRKFFQIIAHIIFWLLAFGIITRIFGIKTIEIFETNEGTKEVITYDDSFFYTTLVFFVFSILVFYINLYGLLPEYFKNRKSKTYISRLLLIIFTGLGMNALINKLFTHQIPDDLVWSLYPSFGLHLVFFILFLAISFAYAFTGEWFKSEHLKSQLQKEKLSTELNFLKSQINPHFLFNALNNLYAIAQHHEVEELSTGIEELSNLMRYMLYESNSDYVPLKKEIKYLHSFIEIQQLRIDEKDDFIINFEIKGNLDGISIAPLILLPFVENAFKHGISQTKTSIIHISIERHNNQIHFRTSNNTYRETNGNKDESGIGLENVKRRLNLLYPNNHQLTISEKQDKYQVDLKINADG